MTSQRTPQPILFGNLGGDPQTITLSGRVRVQEVYDPILDDVVEREYTEQAREFLVASLAVNSRDLEGETITRWIRLVDYQKFLSTYRKGDRLKVTGYFRERSYHKDGVSRSIREYILTSASLERLKIRDEAA